MFEVDSALADYMLGQTKAVLAIDSPTGYTRRAADYVLAAYRAMGYDARLTPKGGVLVPVAPGDAAHAGDGVLVEAHLDTLGAMVAEVLPSGRLRLTPLGGMNACNAETENVRIITRAGKTYTGTFQLKNASIHVNGDYSGTKRTFDACEVVIDEPAAGREDVLALGIAVGDIVCFDPRTEVTDSGYIKSRFLDDKLSVGILLGYARALADGAPAPARPVWHHITVYEEVGHGAAATMPAGCSEVLSVDMGCVGEGLSCTERQVSICAKDSGGPYDYEVVGALVRAARRAGADYAVDVYPFYGSDAEAALKAGWDVRHGLIGAGVYASHGYERSHVDGMVNTLKLLLAYLGGEEASEEGGEAAGAPAQDAAGGLDGGAVILRPCAPTDAALYARWMHEPAILDNYLDEGVDMTADMARDFLQKRQGQPSFIILEKDSRRPVGFCELASRDDAVSSAALGIFIGEADCRRKGLARAALQALLAYGFGALGLRSVWLTTWEGNAPALGLYRSLGFRQAGVRRDAWRRSGKLYGLVYMDLLAEEFSPADGPQERKEAPQ